MQTASTEHQNAFKESEVKRLTEEAWKHKVSAEHLRTTIPRLEDLMKKAADEAEPLRKELEGLDPADKTRETREKRKTLERKIENSEKGIDYCGQQIESILKQIAHLNEQSQAQLKRAQFMEDNFPACLDYKEPEEAVEPSADNGIKAS
jgi:chromosome segregation ATPase